MSDFIWSPLVPDPLVAPELASLLMERHGGWAVQPVTVSSRVEDRDTGAMRGEVPAALRAGLAKYLRLRAARAFPLVWSKSSIAQDPTVEPVPLPCAECGYVDFALRDLGPKGFSDARWIEGVAWVEVATEIDALGTATYVTTRHPRVPGKGLAFDRSTLGGAAVWSLEGRPSMLLCSEAVKSTIESYGATNVDFLEIGSLTDLGALDSFHPGCK